MLKVTRRFQSLKLDVHIQQEEPHRVDTIHLKLSNDVNIKYIARDLDKIDKEMKKLINQLTSNKAFGVDLVIGFDLEWNITSDEGIDVMQVAYNKTVYVLHMDRRWSALSDYLTGLLRNNDVKKVSRNVGGDYGRAYRKYKIICK